MNRIGIDARLLFYRQGGIATYIRELTRALAEAPTQLEFVVFHSRRDSTMFESRFAHRRLWTPPHHRIERSALSVELWPHQLDLWFSPDFIPPRRGGRYHIITVHDLNFLHYPQFLTADSRRYYNDQIKIAVTHADRIFAVSQATRTDLINLLGVPAEKIVVQPHGVDPRYRRLDAEQVRSRLRTLGLPQTYFLHVGTLEPRKNITGLAHAYRALLDQYPTAPPLLLVGRRGWLYDEIEAQLADLHLGERFIWREDITDADLPTVYNGALALVMPSFYEGFGLPALEAMACGTVPIVSDHSAPPEVVGDTGILIDADNPQTIREAMERTWHDATWRQEQAATVVQRAAQFTWERSAQIALHTFNAVLYNARDSVKM